jgi:hypothetical protein
MAVAMTVALALSAGSAVATTKASGAHPPAKAPVVAHAAGHKIA